MGRFNGNSCRLSVMLALTFSYFLVEIIVGYITNSMALVADSFHMISDVLALIVAFFCLRVSKKKTESNTFGWVRAEIVGALVNAVFLLALCFSIVLESIKRLFKPEMIEKPDKILIVGSVGLLVNILGLLLFHHGHGHSHASVQPTETVPNAKKRVFLHVLGDALGSVIVILNAVLTWKIDNEALHKYLDPSLSIVMAFIIAGTSIPLFKRSAYVLLETIPSHIDADQLHAKMTNIDGVGAVHEFHIWSLAGDRIIATAHVELSTIECYPKVANEMKHLLHTEGIHSSTIQAEFPGIKQNHAEEKQATNNAHETRIEMTPKQESQAPNPTLKNRHLQNSKNCLLRCPTQTCDLQRCCA